MKVTPTGVLVTSAPPETEPWFAARRDGITGTDLPRILGYSTFGNALSVWLDKRGELPDNPPGEPAYWGQILEDPIARRWAELNNMKVRRVGVLAHAGDGWMRASLDRLVTGCPYGRCGLEVKNRNAYVTGRYRDGVPDDIAAQVLWGLRVTGLDHMHVAVLIGGNDLRTFRIDRDPEVEEYLVKQARVVWDAVQEGVPPTVDPDGDGVLLDLLNRLYADREGERDLDPSEADPWVGLYRVGHRTEADGKRLKKRAVTGLVQLIDDGDAARLDDRPLFTYRRSSDSVSVTADDVRRMLRDDPDLHALLTERDYLTTRRGTRRFHPQAALTEETP